MPCKNSSRAPNGLELVYFLNHKPNGNNNHSLSGEYHLSLEGNLFFKRNHRKNFMPAYFMLSGFEFITENMHANKKSIVKETQMATV